MNIAIYVRVSTEEQAKHGYSLTHQLSTCREQAQKDNPTEEIIFTEYIDDGYSGEYLERPFLMNLREAVRSSFINKIYCYDPDRLSRKLMHQLLLDEELNKFSSLIFVNGEYEKTPEGKLFYQLRGAVAEFEKAKINERMTNGRKTKAKKGMVIKNNHIYGYDYDKENGKMIINDKEAKIVQFIFNSFTATTGNFRGINGIALYLSQSGISTKKGKETWHRQVVRQILLNPTYTGKFIQNKWNSEGILGNKFKTDNKVKVTKRPEEEWIVVPCPKIIEQVQFVQAQKLLETARRRWSGTSNNKYLLSGLVKCNECGNTMVGRRRNMWGRFLFYYSDIKSVAGTKNKGCGNTIRCEKLDALIWDKMCEWFENYKKPKEENQVFVSYVEEEKVNLNKQLKEKESGRKQFIKTIREGKIIGLTQDEINEALMESQKEIQDIKERLNNIDKQLETNLLQRDKEKFEEEQMIRYVSKKPEEFTFEDKQALIRFKIREIRIDKEENIKIFGF